MNDNHEPWLLKLKVEPSQNANYVEQEEDSIPSDTVGLALSGGGVRSATFCLGILQSLARSNWLPRLDYLSTVSGGGYIGAFLGRFFDVADSPERVHEALKDSRSHPINWLRTHSNYLSPNGIGDTMFNLTSFWRNFFTIQFVLAVLVFSVFGLGNAIVYAEWQEQSGWFAQVVTSVIGFVAPLAPVTLGLENLSFVSPWIIFAEVLFWLALIPLGLAYWTVSQDRHEDVIIPVLAASLLLSVVALIGTGWPGSIAVFVAVIFWITFAWRQIKKNEGHGGYDSKFRMALGRNYLTSFLSLALTITVGLVGFGAIDMAGYYVSEVFLKSGNDWHAVYGLFGGSASLLALVPLLRGIAGYLASTDDKKTGFFAALARIPYLPTLAILTIGGFLPLTVISFLSHTVYELGFSWWTGFFATLSALAISFLIGRQSLIAFVNRSGILTVYGARIARVFLGAVNPKRLRDRSGKDVGYVIDGDDTPLCNYKPHESGGPVHLINVAVNETIDVASQRGIRDRQAENMAIGPAGINVSKNYHALWDNSQENKLHPIGELTSSHAFLNDQRTPVEVEGLNLREWIAISGAAVSSGMGRSTSSARSLLFTITNLRLGYWWNSGIWSSDRFRVFMKQGVFGRVRDFVYRFFAPQALLIAELLGRFGGPWRRHWYLTDGGHFEVSGGYELIRRRVPYIIVVDAGADEKHQGADLGVLIRLSRVDFGAEFESVCPEKAREAGAPEEVTEHLGTLKDLLADPGANPKKHAALFKVHYPKANTDQDPWHGRYTSWLLYVKATVVGDEPPDILNYRLEHPDFPNESTLDQFFDEPQWESYRKLGECIGAKLFPEGSIPNE